MYSTITEKGQITLPAEFRRNLGLQPGCKVSMRELDGAIVVGTPVSIDVLRARAKSEMTAAGTWGRPVDARQGWASAAAEKLGH